MYTPKKEAVDHEVRIRNLHHRVHTWGNPDGLPVFMVHGWADTGMSFQFMADTAPDDWFLIAPDLRGFGDTQWNISGYWFPDYLADLDALLDHFVPADKVVLAGHSMGGNIAWLYAGIRTERLSHVISLDGFGLAPTSPGDAPQRYKLWLDQLQQEQSFSPIDDFNRLVSQVEKLAPRLSSEKAEFIATSWSKYKSDSGYLLRADPAHKRINPVLYRREEAIACWANITVPCLLVLGRESKSYAMYDKKSYRDECRSNITDFQEIIIEDAGHMMHLEHADELVWTLEKFLLENKQHG